MGSTRRTSRKKARRMGVSIRRKLFILLLGVSLLLASFYMVVSEFGEGGVNCGSRRALVADALSTEFPNPELDRFLVETLKEAGFNVDYVNGTDVDLGLYSRLTEYQVVIIRTHGAFDFVEMPGSGEAMEIHALVTGLPWDDKYTDLAEKLLVAKARPYYSPELEYVAVLPEFFVRRLKGEFCPGSVVIVASCFSFSSYELPVAMAEKGLSLYVGWTGPVTVDELDESLRLLVELMFKNNLPWTEAIHRANQLLNKNPYGTRIQAIPLN